MPRDHTPVFFTIIDYEEHKCHLVRIGNLLVSLIITLFIEFGIKLVATLRRNVSFAGLQCAIGQCLV